MSLLDTLVQRQISPESAEKFVGGQNPQIPSMNTGSLPHGGDFLGSAPSYGGAFGGGGLSTGSLPNGGDILSDPNPAIRGNVGFLGGNTLASLLPLLGGKVGGNLGSLAGGSFALPQPYRPSPEPPSNYFGNISKGLGPQVDPRGGLSPMGSVPTFGGGMGQLPSQKFTPMPAMGAGVGPSTPSRLPTPPPTNPAIPPRSGPGTNYRPFSNLQ